MLMLLSLKSIVVRSKVELTDINDYVPDLR